MAREPGDYLKLAMLAVVTSTLAATGSAAVDSGQDRDQWRDATPTRATETSGNDCEPGWDNDIGQPGITLGGWVNALESHNGQLYVGGVFDVAGGVAVNNIARWDGTSWPPLGSACPGTWQSGCGTSGDVHALVSHGGHLVAAGQFQNAGGNFVQNIARWDGSAWHSFGIEDNIGLAGPVRALTVYNGELIAGGDFIWDGGGEVQLNHIARWDGSAWQPFMVGEHIGMNTRVSALAVYNGELIAGGMFGTAGGVVVNRIARWDGASWQPLGNGVSGFVNALTVYNGELIVGGTFGSIDGVPMNYIARWDGTSWYPFIMNGNVGVDNYVWSMTVYGGDLIVAGTIMSAGGIAAKMVARWDGEAWHALASGADSTVFATVAHGESLFVGGYLSSAGGLPSNRIARWGGCVEPTCDPGDLNCDGLVDVFDLIELINLWGPCDDPNNCPADLSGPAGEPDGVVDVFDLIALINNWGQ